MKQRKQQSADKEYKKNLHSLNWVTDILKRYFKGELNEQDEKIVEAHLKSIDIQSEAKESLTEKQQKESDERIRKQVFARLNLNDPKRKSEKILLLPLFRRYAAIAAIFAAMIATSYFILTDQISLRNEQTALLQDRTTFIQTNDTEIKEAILPDGTKLYINGGTRIDYIKDEFNKEKREIWLEGEAFFDVSKNPNKPFIIHSEKIQTVVRGTSFNVKAYKEIGEISVSVRTGKVEVGTAENVFGVLTANKRIVYSGKSNQHNISESNWEEEAAWRDQRLVLKDANVAELKLRMKQLYGVNISADGAFSDNQRFGLSFRKDASLNDILKMLSELYNIKYEIKEQNKVIIHQ